MSEICWPQRIPKPDRIKLDTGHRSFCLRRTHVGDAFDRQRIALTGHLLIAVATGSVVVESDQQQLLVGPGDAALVPQGKFLLTEVPVSRGLHGEIFYHFFDTPVLRDFLSPQPGLEGIALSLRPWPADLGLVHQGCKNAMSTLRLGGVRFPDHFSKSLHVLINQGSAAVFSFLTKSFFLPKLRLNLLMEQHILGTRRPDTAYPGGITELERALRRYQGLTTEGWLRKRRAELTEAWLTHSCADPESVAERFGYRGFPDLRRDLFGGKRETHVVPDPRSTWRYLPTSSLHKITTPFWLPVPVGYHPASQSRLRSEEDSSVESSSVSADAAFWSVGSTLSQIGNVIRFHYGDASPAASLLGEFGLAQAA